MALILARLRETEMLRTPVGGGNRRGRGDAAKSRNIVEWRAMVDEDGHYSFAVAL
jgi:hypothetical protein